VIALLRILELVALSVWVGAIIFFSFVVAPTLSSALPQETFGRAVGALFPRYYLTCGVCAGAAILSAGALWLSGTRRGLMSLAVVIMLVAMAGATAWAGLRVLPEAREARERMYAAAEGAPREQARLAFDAIHRRSVMLNGGTLLMGLAILAMLAQGRKP